MTSVELRAVKDGCYAAGHIAAICSIMADSLQADPATTLIGEAIEGIGIMARDLSNNLNALDEQTR